MDALTPEMMKQIAEHILKNPEEARNDEDLIDFYHKHCDDCREQDESESEEEDDCAECCNCGEDVSNDEGEGKLVDGEYWCVDCVEDANQCELCKKYFKETEYLPSKEDQEKQQILGNDYCLECYKKVEKFEFVENIKDESESEEEEDTSSEDEDTEYTNCLNMEQVEWLGLFDDIPYGQVKHFIKEEEYDLEVEITDLEYDRVAWCKTKIEFYLPMSKTRGSTTIISEKKFEVIKEYNNSSPMAMFMVDLKG